MTNLSDIPQYEGRYQASDTGEIFSLLSNKYLKQSLHSTGRMQVTLVRNSGKRVTRKVHTLVAEAFLGARPLGLVVCHNDGNPLNNSIENLRYDTQKANVAEAVGHHSVFHSSKTECPRGHPYDSENTYHYRGNRQCNTCRKMRNNKEI